MSIQLYVPSAVIRAGRVQTEQAVAVSGGDIIAVGDREQLAREFATASIVDWHGLALVPGTVNAHNHSFQSLLRGIATDEPFLQWRDRALYAHTPLLTPDVLYAGALLAFGEMLLCGVTTVADFFYVHGPNDERDLAIIRAARDLGIRFVMARTMYDWSGAPALYRETVADAVSNTRALAERFADDPLIDVHPAPHSPHAASPDMIRAGHRLAAELGTPFHIHVAEEPFEVEGTLREHGLRPVHLLDHLGVLDESLIAIHLVWLEDSEIHLLGDRRAGLAYCPSSNMFLADGVTRIPDLLAAGVRVGLGSDGACSNNRVSVFEEMRMVSLLQKVARLDATAVNATSAFTMGTLGGAQLLRLPSGDIAPGLRADFVGLDTSHLSLAPYAPDKLVSHIVYSMQPDAVRHVVVHGRHIVLDGTLQTVPRARIGQLVADAVRAFATS
ncbi:MAG: amidohydrolase [Firmicutes bacterium]|nr:amidohydrolase [Bacillota bacterium]